jgi:beta-lactamase regulating signal transducer with metallopeptidase domain
VIRIHSAKFLRALAIVWGMFSFVLLARLAAGYCVLRNLKSSATPASPDWQMRFRRLCATHDIRRRPQLLVSSHISGPMSLGFFRPTIVIPRSLLETLSNSELEQIVLHELAHLNRRDDWSNLAQKLIEAVLPIQPAVYWLGYQMSLAREMACDDWVIAATGTPRPYAAALTKVAELSQWQRAGVLAAEAAGNRSQLFRRVRQMLDRTRNSAPKLSVAPLASVLAVVVGLTCLCARAPQLIAFAQSVARGAISPAVATDSHTDSHDDHGSGFGSSRPDGPCGSAIRNCCSSAVRTTRTAGGSLAHVTAVSTIAAVSDEPAISLVAARPDGAGSVAAER